MNATSKRVIRKVAPEPVMSIARSLRRTWRRKRWEKSVESGQAQHLTQAQLEADLAGLGLVPGRDVLVHSALSRLGFVEGGPETVLKALRNVIGPEATLLTPCYPMKQSMIDTMNEEGAFDVEVDESTMGKITRVFRMMPGSKRSAHPTHSVAANGPRAEQYTKTHHLSESPCGPGSPFKILSENRGDILCLGSGVGKVTSHHTVEDIAEHFPCNVYIERSMTKQVKFSDGRVQEVTVRVHDPALGPRRIDNHPEKEQEILQRMREAGIVKEGKVGMADCHLFGAHDLDEFHLANLKDGVTIYAA